MNRRHLTDLKSLTGLVEELVLEGTVIDENSVIRINSKGIVMVKRVKKR